MFHQLLMPVGDSLALSFLVAIVPITVVLILLGVVRRPAWQAALAGLIIALIIAVAVWDMPARIALAAACNGAVFALWPVMWIVVNALFVYNIAVASGRFDAFRAWVIKHLPNDRRVVLIVMAFCFGALLEGVAGFGAPVAIVSSLLIMCGFPALDAVVFVLIFNTTPVAFGALGAPVTVLGAVTSLPAPALAAMVGRQLPLIAAFLPFYVMALYGGWRSIRALWPMLAVAGLSFGAAQFGASNYLDYTLTDVFAALASLAATLLFLQVWRPAVSCIRHRARRRGGGKPEEPQRAGVAGMDALADFDGRRHRMDDIQGRRHRPALDLLAGVGQSRGNHALQGQTLHGRVGLSAARDRNGHPGRRVHHGAGGRIVAG